MSRVSPDYRVDASGTLTLILCNYCDYRCSDPDFWVARDVMWAHLHSHFDEIPGLHKRFKTRRPGPVRRGIAEGMEHWDKGAL